jgi:ketosteroid isomerase-like protein
MKADAQTVAEIDAAIGKLAGAYRERNLQDFMACFVPDEDTVVIGTGSDEKRVGPEQIRAQVERDWSQTESIEMAFEWKSISAAGPLAWVALEGAFRIRAGGQAMALPVRTSLVLEKRRGQWLVVHAHFSAPAATQEAGSSV